MPESECRTCTHYRPRSDLLAYDIVGRMESTQSLSSHERTQLSQLAQQAELDVRGYTEQLAHLRAQMMAITVEQRAFQVRLASFKSLLSPFRMLPVELVGEIFSYCCAGGTSILYEPKDQDDMTWLQGLYMQAPAATLGQVCRTWRKIIYEQPSFWDKIDLQIFDEFRTDTVELQIEACIAYVLRASGSQPLSITIRDSSGKMPSAPVARLVAESKRWKSADLNFRGSRRMATISFRELEGNLPLLTHLSVKNAPRDNVDHPSLTLFANAPLLRVIRGWRMSSRTFAFPWIQVQNASLDMSTPQQLGTLLSQAVNIQTISVNGMLFEDEDTAADRTLASIACNATTAILTFDRAEGNEGMLSLLACPQLKMCTIKQEQALFPGRPGIEPPQYGIFTDFFSHCRTTLTELTLVDVHFKGRTEFMAVLGILTQLEVLSLLDASRKPLLTKSILSSLDACPSENAHRAIVPRLKRLSINIDRQGDVEFLDLFSLVISRSAHPAPFNAVDACRLENVFLRLGGQKCSYEFLKSGSMDFVGTGIRVAVEDEEGVVNLRGPAS